MTDENLNVWCPDHLTMNQLIKDSFMDSNLK